MCEQVGWPIAGEETLTTGGGRLAGVDVADDDQVDVNLLLLTRMVVS